jgi:hypothetical protein
MYTKFTRYFATVPLGVHPPKSPGVGRAGSDRGRPPPSVLDTARPSQAEAVAARRYCATARIQSALFRTNVKEIVTSLEFYPSPCASQNCRKSPRNAILILSSGTYPSYLSTHKRASPWPLRKPRVITAGCAGSPWGCITLVGDIVASKVSRIHRGSIAVRPWTRGKQITFGLSVRGCCILL